MEAAAKIYAVNMSIDCDYFRTYFKSLKSYFLQVAKRRNGMLIYMD